MSRNHNPNKLSPKISHTILREDPTNNFLTFPDSLELRDASFDINLIPKRSILASTSEKVQFFSKVEEFHKVSIKFYSGAESPTNPKDVEESTQVSTFITSYLLLDEKEQNEQLLQTKLDFLSFFIKSKERRIEFMRVLLNKSLASLNIVDLSTYIYGNSLKDSEGDDVLYLIHQIKHRNVPTKVRVSLMSIQALSVLVNQIVTEAHRDNDLSSIHLAIICGEVFVSTINAEEKNLLQFVGEHAVWSDLTFWRHCLYKLSDMELRHLYGEDIESFVAKQTLFGLSHGQRSRGVKFLSNVCQSFIPLLPEEIQLVEGDTVLLAETNESLEWWCGQNRRTGATGFFPSKCISKEKQILDSKEEEQVEDHEEERQVRKESWEKMELDVLRRVIQKFLDQMFSLEVKTVIRKKFIRSICVELSLGTMDRVFNTLVDEQDKKFVLIDEKNPKGSLRRKPSNLGNLERTNSLLISGQDLIPGYNFVMKEPAQEKEKEEKLNFSDPSLASSPVVEEQSGKKSSNSLKIMMENFAKKFKKTKKAETSEKEVSIEEKNANEQLGLLIARQSKYTAKKYAVNTFEKRVFAESQTCKPAIQAKFVNKQSVIASFVDGSLALFDVRSLTCKKVFDEKHFEWPAHLVSIEATKWFSACYGGSVKLWDINQCVEITGLDHVHSSAVTDMQVDSGNKVLTGSLDGTVRVWDMRVGALPAETKLAMVANMECKSSVNCVRVSSTTVYCGLRSGKVVVFDQRKYELPISRLEAHSDWVTCMAESNGKLATCSYDSTIKVWNNVGNNSLKFSSNLQEELKEKDRISPSKTISNHKSPLSQIEFSSDSTTMISACKGGLLNANNFFLPKISSADTFLLLKRFGNPLTVPHLCHLRTNLGLKCSAWDKKRQLLVLEKTTLLAFGSLGR